MASYHIVPGMRVVPGRSLFVLLRILAGCGLALELQRRELRGGLPKGLRATWGARCGTHWVIPFRTGAG